MQENNEEVKTDSDVENPVADDSSEAPSETIEEKEDEEVAPAPSPEEEEEE